MCLQFNHVRCFASHVCRGKLRNLRADCSTVGLYFVTITWQRIFTCSHQVTAIRSVATSDVLRDISDVWCFCSKSDVDWAYAFSQIFYTFRMTLTYIHGFQVLEHKIGIDFTVSSTLKTPSKNYICFILRRFGLFLIHLQSKIKATLGNASNSKPKDSVTQEITVWRKRRQNQNQDSQPCQIR